MIFRDEFNPNIELEYVYFTGVLGLAFGLMVAGSVLALASQRRRRWGLSVAALGAALGLSVGVLALDTSPVSPVDVRLKPYLARLSEAASLAAGGVATAGAVVALVLFAARAKGRAALASAVAGVVAATVLGLVLVAWYVGDRSPRHPDGTDTGMLVGATRVVEGLEVPTGIALAPNGDLATVELLSAGFHLYAPAGNGFELRIESRLPIPEGRWALHVAFHPGYPDEPVVYVAAEGGEGPQRGLYVYVGRVAGGAVDFQPVAGPFPTATLEDGGDHLGSGLAVCGETLYMSTADAEPRLLQPRALDPARTVRQRAQQLDNAAGKVLRWRIEGSNLIPDGVVQAPIPIYALGFRNPFGIGCDIQSGELFLADNGPNGHDQVRLIRAGSNHEWPLSAERTLIERPLFDSGSSHLAPTGVAVRSGEGGTREVLVSAFQSQAVYVLPLGQSGEVGRLRLLIEVEGGAYGVAVDSAGCAYFSDAEAVWRLDDGRCGD